MLRRVASHAGGTADCVILDLGLICGTPLDGKKDNLSKSMTSLKKSLVTSYTIKIQWFD